MGIINRGVFNDQFVVHTLFLFNINSALSH